MPKKASHNTRKKRQDTLDGFFGVVSTSPPRPQKSAEGSRNTRHRRARSDAIGSEDGSQSSDAGAIHFEEPLPPTDEDDLKSSPRPAKRRRLIKRRADSEDDALSPASGHEEMVTSATRKGLSSKAAGKRREVVPQDDEDEQDVHPRKRKLMKGKRPPSPEEADEEDLRNEVDEKRIIESRLRSRDKKSAFQKNLERLKRRKRGQSVASTSSSESSEDDEVEDIPFEDARPNRRNRNENDEGEENATENDRFIVEDDNDVVPELPAEFSMNTYQDLIHHFKIICQLFVHISVHPLDDREAVVNRFTKDQYFYVPLQTARRKLSGMRDSLVASSIWRSDFKKALETFPEFEVHHLEYTVPGCDACHLGSRLSTRLGRLSGQPYDPTTFQSFEEGDGSDDGSDDDEHDKHTKKEFNLGRFCAARTRVYHGFSHWEWALFKALSLEVDELRTDAGARGFVRVAYARGAKPPDDLSDADGIMDWLDQRGIINIEWQKVKEMMESARNLDMKAKRGEADDDDDD